MRRLSASLGYSGCEIFPKQTKLLVEQGDCPSWIYLPYGGQGRDITGDPIFPEQGCMNDMGNLMEIDAAMRWCMGKRIGYKQFMDIFAAEKAADANGKSKGKKRPDRIWEKEETHQDTIDAMFWDGPVCLRVLTRAPVGQGHQNHFLTQCGIFLLKKYENWGDALSWVNYNILTPVGDPEKLRDMIKRLPTQKYDYLCHDEPMQTYCDAHGCRMKKYGVGADGHGGSYPDLGMTIINRNPRIFIVSVGNSRWMMSAGELLNFNSFQTKFLEAGLSVPALRKKDEHIRWVNAELEKAVKVEPSIAMRTNAAELELLIPFLSSHIRVNVQQGDREEDIVRLDEKEKKVYIKWLRAQRQLRQHYTSTDIDLLRRFFENNCEYNIQGPGIRGWNRNTYSIKFDQFDDEQIEEWTMKPDTTDARRDDKDMGT
jgi:hypothetical protein